MKCRLVLELPGSEAEAAQPLARIDPLAQEQPHARSPSPVQDDEVEGGSQDEQDLDGEPSAFQDAVQAAVEQAMQDSLIAGG